MARSGRLGREQKSWRRWVMQKRRAEEMEEGHRGRGEQKDGGGGVRERLAAGQTAVLMTPLLPFSPLSHPSIYPSCITAKHG